MTGRWLGARLRNHAWPAMAGLGLGVLALGPALGRGFVLSYDMVFVPGPPIGRSDLGLAGGPPRAVPSDLVVALAARILPAELVQKLILLAIFVLACCGAAALLRTAWASTGDDSRPPLVASLAAGACYAWNPFVAERLIMGQWAMLLGYAGLPWLVREVSSRSWPARTWPARTGRLAIALTPAVVGGFAAIAITAVAAVPVALCARQDRAQRAAITLAMLMLASLPWAIPALVMTVHADPAGANAFAARADTPFGSVGSLLMLGGVWNAQAVPAGYGGYLSACWLAVVLLALAGYLVVARRRQVCPGLGIAAIAGFCVAALGLTPVSLTALRSAMSIWPGFAVLRDGQQFVAPLAVAAAIGLGSGVAGLIEAASPRPSDPEQAPSRPPDRPAWVPSAGRPATVLGLLAVLAPICLLPGLAWGAAGRLQAVRYPADWLRARQVIDGSAATGSALLLPWDQYRRYGWNHGEAVFDPWPRLLSRPMIWNDALRVGAITVAAESGTARRTGPVIASGGPFTRSLLALGVRYVVVDAGPLLDTRRNLLAERAGLPGATVVLASRDLVVFRLPAELAR